ncbi:hypothetical protein C8J56DRAFT_274507 [Mycena floridula]|nr:hypothetical protein C8J56DRAFT_274507 [Mycena floridula]
MAQIDHTSTSLKALHRILSAFTDTHLNHEQWKLYGELKSLETAIRLLGGLHSQDNSILLSLNSDLTAIATRMDMHRDDPLGSWLFNADHQPNILLTIARLQSSLLGPNGSYMISGTVAVKDSTFGSVGGSIASNNVMNFNADPAVRKGVDNLLEQAEATERMQFLAWISCLDFHSTHMETASKRTPGTGTWFIQDSRFLDWLNGKLRFLWCPGNPGVGKTILTSLIIDHLRLTMSSNVAVVCIYCDYTQQNDQTPTQLLGSILKQLVEPRESISHHLLSLHRTCMSQKRHPTIPELMDALRQEIPSYSSVYIVGDALDECSNKTQDLFVSTKPDAGLRSLSDTVQILITSRNILSIAQALNGWTCLVIEAQDQDLQTYIKGRILEDNRLKRLIKGDTTLETEIINEITTKAMGKFLQAHLHFDSLSCQPHRKALRIALSTLPKEITSSYDSAMTRIDAQGSIDRTLAYHVFFWLAYAKRPLTVKALQAAIAISMNPDMMDLDEEEMVDVELLTGVCAGLVVIANDLPLKRKSGALRAQAWLVRESTMRLVHYTTQEYFQQKQESFFPTIHSLMTITCLRHLSFNDVDRQWVLQHPFGIYASASWHEHACDDEEKVIQHVLTFLQNKHHSLGLESHPNHFPQPYHLHYLAKHGLHQTLAVMLNENMILLDCVDIAGRTALHFAVVNHHSKVVDLLLDRGAALNLTEKISGCTPLQLAVQNDNVDIVRLLLQHPNIDPGLANREGWTPLMHACFSEHLEIAKLLISHERSIPPNFFYKDGWSELLMAVRSQHVGLVRLLIQHPNLQPGLADEDGWTPLMHACYSEHLEIPKLLVSHEKSIPPNFFYKDGWSELHMAVGIGNVNIVQLLLQHPNIQPGLADRDGWTPLMHA